MPIRTKISGVYLMRLGVVIFFMFGWTLLCLKDGLYSWPATQKYARAMETLEEELKERDDLSMVEKVAKKDALAEEYGWPPVRVTHPGPPRSDGEIQGQFALGAMTVPIGCIFLYLFLRNRGRWIEATEERITTNRGDDFAFDQIVEFNKRQWKKKGIARIFYEDNGDRRKVVLDDCNYEREPTVKILRLVEDKISHDLITQGKPEPPPVEESDIEEGDSEEMANEEAAVDAES